MEGFAMFLAVIGGILVWACLFKFLIIPLGKALSRNPEVVEGGVRFIRRILKK